MNIDKLPGAFWVALFTGIGSVVTVYLTTQYPDNAPAWVAGALVGCSVLVGLAKVLWPAPTVPLTDAPATARGVATTTTSTTAAPAPAPRPSAVSRFFL